MYAIIMLNLTIIGMRTIFLLIIELTDLQKMQNFIPGVSLDELINEN